MPRVTDAHRESRRRQILDASIDCFAREGFHRTSMTQIIAEAGVSAGTIYLYFTSKEEIVEAIAEERHALESALASTALANPDTRQALHDLAGGYVDWLSDPIEQKRRRVTVQVWAEALRNERVASIVREGSANATRSPTSCVNANGGGNSSPASMLMHCPGPCSRSSSASSSNKRGTPLSMSAATARCSMR